MSTEIGQNRRNLLLYLLDVVLFAFVVSALFWVFQTLVPEAYMIQVIIISLVFLAIACWITFKLIVSSTVIDAYIPICLIQNMKTENFVDLRPNDYELAFIATEGFSDLKSVDPKMSDLFFKKEPKLKTEIWKEFWIYAIVKWLTKLSTVIYKFEGNRRQPLRVDTSWLETEEISNELKNSNLFLKNDETLLPIKTLKFLIEKEQVVIRYKPMKISISFGLTSWIRGMDLRISNMLEIPEKDISMYSTVSGFIRYKAEFGASSIFYRKSDKYYLLASQLLENLRQNYDWNEYLDDLKEYFYWLHICKKN